MEYIITQERQAYLNARGYTILMACPGSGKTTSIVYKLKQLCAEQERETNGYGGVACLSFTNAACDEYRGKYRELHHGESLTYPNIISTIDSFVTQFLVLPFAHLLGVKGHVRIENDDDTLEELYHTLYLDKKGKPQTAFIKGFRDFDHKLLKKGRTLYECDNDGYYWKGHKVTDVTEIEYAKACVERRIECGVIKSQDALFIAYKILKEYPSIAKALAKRFPYIIIDEAQDTSGLQMDMVALLKDNGLLNIEFVGDLAQSIYSWRNAKPEILKNLSVNKEYKLLHFTENRRSVQRIINFYELLKDETVPHAISTGVVDAGRDIIMYRFDADSERNIMHSFKDKCLEYGLDSSIILVRGKNDLYRLEGKRNEVRLWKSTVPYLLIRAFQSKETGNYSDALYALRRAWCDCLYSPIQYKEKCEFLETIADDVECNALLLNMLDELPSLDSSFQCWEKLTVSVLQRKLSLANEPDFQQKKSLRGINKAQLLQLPLNNYFGREDYAKQYDGQIMTIHNAKGTSVDAVLLFMSETHNVNTISLSDFPISSHQSVTMTESQRLIYVACSRAKQFLALAFPSTVSEQQIKLKFGSNVVIESSDIQKTLF